MSDNYNLVIALTSITAAVIAIVALISEIKRSRFALGVDSILRLDEYFNTERMIKLRKEAACAILDKTYRNVEDLLDFFETIGLLVKEGALNKKMVWHLFSPWVVNYYQAASEHIKEVRRDDKTVCSNMIYLYNELLKIEKHERRCGESDLIISAESLETFLKDEASL